MNPPNKPQEDEIMAAEDEIQKVLNRKLSNHHDSGFSLELVKNIPILISDPLRMEFYNGDELDINKTQDSNYFDNQQCCAFSPTFTRPRNSSKRNSPMKSKSKNSD